MKGLNYTLTFLLLFLCLGLSAQSKKQKKADEFYKIKEYSSAIPLYEHTLKKKSNLTVKSKLAFCYKAINKNEQAEKLYAEIVKEERARDITYLYYGETLMSNEKYDEAKKWFLKYSEKKPDDEKGRLLAIACSEVKNIQPVFSNVKIKAFTQNGKTDDSGPVYFNNGVVFSSDRPQGVKLLKQKSGTTGRDFVRLYFSPQNFDGTFEPAKPFSNKINELNKNTGPITFSADGTLAVFTRNSKVANKRNIYPMQLYSATSTDGKKWKDVKDLDINRLSSNFMHPALSPDGKTLFFASDRGSGVGGTDLYVSEMKEDGSWGKASNLGATINTSLHEGFPFVHPDGKLYFSSKGHPGFGGFDIFYTEKNENGNWKKPVNIGRPVNSSLDDISIYVFPEGNKGMFTSSREGGDDDVFFFNPKEEEEEHELMAFSDSSDDPVEETNVNTDPEISNPSTIDNSNPTPAVESNPSMTDIPSTETVNTEVAIPSEQEVVSKPKEAVTDLSKTFAEDKDRHVVNQQAPQVKEEEKNRTTVTTIKRIRKPQQQQAADAPSYEIPDTQKETIASSTSPSTETPIDVQEPVSGEPKEITESVAAKVENNEAVQELSFEESAPAIETVVPENTIDVPVDNSVNQNLTEAETAIPQNSETLTPEGVTDRPSSNPVTDSPVSEQSEGFTETISNPASDDTAPATQLPPSLYANDPVTAPASKEDIYESRGIIETSVSSPEPTFIDNPSPEYNTISAEAPIAINSYDDLNYALSASKINPGQSFQLPNIKYDFNEFVYGVTPDIANQLNRVVDIMNNHPSLRIEVGGYTSSYGEDKVNKTLSRYRAEAALEYLISQGISKDRLTARGYGESKLLNDCRNGVLCSRAQHMQNQRLEMKVLVF